MLFRSTGKKIYADEMACAPVDVKAASIAAENIEETVANEMAQVEE